MQVQNLAPSGVVLLISRGCYEDYFVNLDTVGCIIWVLFLLKSEAEPTLSSDDCPWNRVLTLQAYNAVNNVDFKQGPA